MVAVVLGPGVQARLTQDAGDAAHCLLEQGLVIGLLGVQLADQVADVLPGGVEGGGGGGFEHLLVDCWQVHLNCYYWAGILLIIEFCPSQLSNLI